MNNFTQVIRNFWNDEEGLTAVEYAVAGSLVVAGLVAAFTALGDQVQAVIESLTAAITPAP